MQPDILFAIGVLVGLLIGLAVVLVTRGINELALSDDDQP